MINGNFTTAKSSLVILGYFWMRNKVWNRFNEFINFVFFAFPYTQRFQTTLCILSKANIVKKSICNIAICFCRGVSYKVRYCNSQSIFLNSRHYIFKNFS